MKKLNNSPVIILFISYYLIMLGDAILRPLNNLPKPDLNNQYDSTML
jgi:hypothetical protein